MRIREDLIQIASFHQYVHIVCEPVQHVKESGSHVCQLQELVSIALGNDLNSFDLKQRLRQSKELSGLSYFL